MKIQRASLVGLGAIGSLFAPALYQTLGDGFCVVADEERIRRYQETPLVINGQTVTLTYQPPGKPDRPDDLILIATKRDALEQAVKLIAPRVGKDTIVLSLLNGIDSEQVIEQMLQIPPIMPAYVIMADPTRVGRNVHYSAKSILVFGERDGSRSERALAVLDLLERCGCGAQLSEQIVCDLWWKYMVNCALNPLTALLGATYGDYNRSEHLRACAEAAMKEVVALANAMGVALNEQQAIGRFEKNRKGFGEHGKSSMLQDLEGGRPTEIDMLCGTVARLGPQLGVATPVNEMLWRMIVCREEMAGLRPLSRKGA